MQLGTYRLWLSASAPVTRLTRLPFHLRPASFLPTSITTSGHSSITTKRSTNSSHQRVLLIPSRLRHHRQHARPPFCGTREHLPACTASHHPRLRGQPHPPPPLIKSHYYLTEISSPSTRYTTPTANSHSTTTDSPTRHPTTRDTQQTCPANSTNLSIPS